METILEKQFAVRARTGKPAAAIFTDLDGTYELAGHPGSAAAAMELASAAAEESCPLIVVSGRAASEIMAWIDQGKLPPFPAIIGAVGTEILYLQADGGYHSDEAFAALLEDKRYDRHAIAQSSLGIMEGLLAANPQCGITFQRPEREHQFLQDPKMPVEPYKVSFFFFAPAHHDMEQVAAPFRAAFPDQKVVMCEEIIHNTTIGTGDLRRYCLDIVPVTKVDAVNYMVERYAITEGVVAGDSGNDIDMLLDTPDGLVGVLVGGHRAEAMAALEARLGRLQPGDFQQFGNKRLYIDRYPERQAAESIVAAIRTLGGPLTLR